MDPKLELMLRKAREGIAGGADTAAVEAWLHENGWERSLADLANRVERDRQQAAAAVAREESKTAPGGLPALARIPLAFMRGVTAGFLPEMIGTTASSFGYDPEALSEDIRGQMDRARFEHPVEAGVAELTGALATVPATGPAAGRALPAFFRAVGTGAGFGAATGAGYAEPGERASGAARGAVFGAALGALPGAGAAAARFLRPPEREILRRAVADAPVVSKRLAELRKVHSAWARSPEGYGGLPDVAVTGSPEFFAQPRVAGLVEQAKELELMGSLPKPNPEGVYTFKTLQEIKERLDDAVSAGFKRGTNRLAMSLAEVRDDLVNTIEQAVPGYKQVNANYRALLDRERALAAGYKAGKGSADPAEVRWAASQLDDEALKEYRYGFTAGTRPKMPAHELEDVARQTAGAALSPFRLWQMAGRGGLRLAGASKSVRRAESLLPFMFRGKEIEDVARTMAPGARQRVAQSYGPAGLGFLLGSHDYAQSPEEETP